MRVSLSTPDLVVQVRRKMKDREEPRPEKELETNGSPYKGLSGESPPEWGTFFMLQTW